MSRSERVLLQSVCMFCKMFSTVEASLVILSSVAAEFCLSGDLHKHLVLPALRLWLKWR